MCEGIPNDMLDVDLNNDLDDSISTYPSHTMDTHMDDFNEELGVKKVVRYNEYRAPISENGVKLKSFIGSAKHYDVAFVIDPRSRKNILQTAGKRQLQQDRRSKETASRNKLSLKDRTEILKRKRGEEEGGGEKTSVTPAVPCPCRRLPCHHCLPRRHRLPCSLAIVLPFLNPNSSGSRKLIGKRGAENDKIENRTGKPRIEQSKGYFCLKQPRVSLDATRNNLQFPLCTFCPCPYDHSSYSDVEAMCRS
ncbi:putative serine/threonine-protein kinase nek2 [Cucumis melo var. makuwa]|uniref:Serine/threonine-protein kinase nek2 n=1 Tax=Cucumis melo var. makuwa TaxID=1194695 RepID=A0A5A7U7N7_CUCMM|nr:putative serine/threonine-protein kinase nek2 [Cucumis melo var. makuwa]